MNIPKEIQQYFNQTPVKFEVSKFEEYLLNDIYERDESSKIKLNRDVTNELKQEIELYLKQKRNIRFTIMGETRSGKSLVGLKVGNIIYNYQNKNFSQDINKLVCGNQIEYRQKLLSAEFGDFYLIDENTFNRSGLGANIEAMQLIDYNNIIAKKNISLVFITPQKFLNVGATLGFSSYGRDSKNWLSRFLVYKFKDNFPYLIGYVVFDIGSLFRDNGCYIYNYIGGCNNTQNKSLNDIPKELIKHSTCITNKDITQSQNEKVCPFYDICNHALNKYEHKKDTWIQKEMAGGLDERTHERFKTALLLLLGLKPEYREEKGNIKLNASNGKDLKNKVKLKIGGVTNTKFGIAEQDEIIEIIKSCCDIDFLNETLQRLDDTQLYNEYMKSNIKNLIKKPSDNK